MHDIITKPEIKTANVSKVHGKTRIILTEVKTGKKKIIEHKNTFQSRIIAAQLRSLGAANNSPWQNETWAGRPLWRNLCGGILLFRDAITAPAEYAPATNLMVGNGAYGVTNNATPAELGSYNSIESATGGAASLTFVYDWGTSQGNGTIGCVCLTSELGGYIGYGNASGASASARSILQNQESNQNGAHLYYNGTKIRIVNVDYSTKKITIAKSNDGLEIASIFQGQNEETSEISYSGSPSGDGSGYTFARAISATEILIYKSTTEDQISSGSSAGLLIYDAATNTASVVTVSNTSGKTIIIIEGGLIRVTKDATGNYYIPAYNENALAKFDSTGTYIETYTGIGGASSGYNGIIAPGLAFSSMSASGSVMNIIYGSTPRPTNGSAPSALMHIDGYDVLALQQRSLLTTGNQLDKIVPYKNPLYLATINNLESAITKDSTQTMKVIYTLTEAGA